ncbi:MAG: outer membrane homotrimeric porin [Pseudodesulfovibrio sp.]|nr:outer membrane homotrimeric porin [Pseudodesulfovibrio sp.]
MKRLTLLAVALVFVLGLAASASAAPEVVTSGNLLVNAVWKDNWNFKNNGDRNNGKTFTVYERADLYFTITANENLKGVLGLRSSRGEWGEGGFANDVPGDNGNIDTATTLKIRDAYIDFNWPGTAVNVKAGIQPVSLPASIGGGSMIQNARAGAAFVSTAFTDNVSLLAGWARLNNEVNGNNRGDLDAWIVALPLNFEGFSFTPFGAYAPVGKGITYGDVHTAGYTGLAALNGTPADEIDNAYWLGAAFTMDLFDPFVLKADVNYGKVSAEHARSERDGWLFDAALEYKGFDFMTPELFFVYTTGEDGNGTKGNGSSERMPVLKGDWAVGSFFFGGDSITGGSMDDNAAQLGFWTVGLSLKDIQSFAEGLTHSVHFMYVKGTNDKDSFAQATGGVRSGGILYGRTLTEDDHLYEVSTTTAYKIYDELTAYVDLGYINLDAKSSVWNTTAAGSNKGGDAWKFSTGVVYQF